MSTEAEESKKRTYYVAAPVTFSTRAPPRKKNAKHPYPTVVVTFRVDGEDGEDAECPDQEICGYLGNAPHNLTVALHLLQRLLDERASTSPVDPDTAAALTAKVARFIGNVELKPKAEAEKEAV